MFEMLSAAFTGTVDFSTTIFLPAPSSTVSAIILAASSTYLRSAALPFPRPKVFVGVFTDMKIRSAPLIAASISVEKCRFLPRTSSTTSESPGSYMGRFGEFQAVTLSWDLSNTVTLISGHCLAMMQQVGPPTYPAPRQQMDFTDILDLAAMV